MLTWYRETYTVTSGDAGGTWVSRFWTPDGINHDPVATGRTVQRQDWRVHFMHVYVLKTTSGCVKQGLTGCLCVALENSGGFVPLSAAGQYGVYLPMRGLVYDGVPFLATHGIGWTFYKGALANTDKVGLRLLYEPIGPKGA